MECHSGERLSWDRTQRWQTMRLQPSQAGRLFCLTCPRVHFIFYAIETIMSLKWRWLCRHDNCIRKPSKAWLGTVNTHTQNAIPGNTKGVYRWVVLIFNILRARGRAHSFGSTHTPTSHSRPCHYVNHFLLEWYHLPSHKATHTRTHTPRGSVCKAPA